MSSVPTPRRVFYTCLGGLALTHLVLFVGLALLMPTFEARLALFSVNTLPWRVLHEAGLPVTTYGWLVLPNLLGWVWSILSWLAIYGAVAFGFVTLNALPLRRRPPPA